MCFSIIHVVIATLATPYFPHVMYFFGCSVVCRHTFWPKRPYFHDGRFGHKMWTFRPTNVGVSAKLIGLRLCTVLARISHFQTDLYRYFCLHWLLAPSEKQSMLSIVGCGAFRFLTILARKLAIPSHQCRCQRIQLCYSRSRCTRSEQSDLRIVPLSTLLLDTDHTLSFSEKST